MNVPPVIKPHTVTSVYWPPARRVKVSRRPLIPCSRPEPTASGATRKNHKGQKVMMASSKACVRCHNKDYEQMFGLWKREVSGELEKAVRMEKEAADALAKYKSQVDKEKLDMTSGMLKAGRENLRIVRVGNGIHNAKYAIELLDSAITNFKDMIAILEGKDLSESLIQEE